MLKNIFRAFNDLYILNGPVPDGPGDAVAFVMHLREVDDVYRKFPFFKYLPNLLTLNFIKFLWPITVSKITGLKSIDSGKDIPGWIISIPLTARQMIEDRELAKRKIMQAMSFARRKNVRMVALGALTSSFTNGGLHIKENVDIGITTGHAYTVYNVTQTLLSIIKTLEDNVSNSTVAIVGANGSIGSNCAQILSEHNFKKIILIDVSTKNLDLGDLTLKMKQKNPNLDVEIKSQVQAVKDADYIITATNAPEALIRADDLSIGAVVIDDAQPTDIDDSVFNRDDVLVLEAGAVHTPGIKPNFNIDLKNSEDNFSCLAEALILTASNREDLAVIGRASIKQVREIGELGSKLGFTIAEYQNKNGIITKDHLHKISQIKKGYN